MSKPDFGNVGGRIEWTAERIAWVRHLAEDRRMTARDIAVDVGLAADQAPRIHELCRRCGIALSGHGGRPKRGVIHQVAILGHNVDLLRRLARRHALHPGRLAELLLNAAFETGETFCENLMDLNGEA